MMRRITHKSLNNRRALQIEPKHCNPQPSVQMCLYVCTASVVVQTLTAIIMPHLRKV